jgi:hypothetical protein
MARTTSRRARREGGAAMSAWDDLASIYETEIAVRRRRRRRRRKSPTRWVRDDGGRDAAGLGREQRDCVVRAIAIETGKPYHEVHAELTAEILRYVKTHRNRITGWIKRSRGGRGFNPDYGCYDKVYAPYLGALGWRFIFTEERGLPRRRIAERAIDCEGAQARRRRHRRCDPRHV